MSTGANFFGDGHKPVSSRRNVKPSSGDLLDASKKEKKFQRTDSECQFKELTLNDTRSRWAPVRACDDGVGCCAEKKSKSSLGTPSYLLFFDSLFAFLGLPASSYVHSRKIFQLDKAEGSKKPLFRCSDDKVISSQRERTTFK